MNVNEDDICLAVLTLYQYGGSRSVELIAGLLHLDPDYVQEVIDNDAEEHPDEPLRRVLN